MLIGDVPFKGETSTKTLTSHVFDPVIPPSQRRTDLTIPPALEEVVMRTLSKKPADRYADLRELMNELDKVEAELRAGRLGAAKPREADALRPTEVNTTVEEEIQPARSNLPLYIGIGAAVVVLVGMTLFAIGGSAKKPPTVAPSAPVAAAPAAPQKDPPPVDPKNEVELMLRTNPPGAEVFDGMERLGVSPLTLKRPRADGALTLTFKHTGYKDVSREITPDRDRDLEVVLVVKPKAVASAPRTRPTAQPAQPQHTSPKRVSDLRNPFE
jgi:hypothetical protein